MRLLRYFSIVSLFFLTTYEMWAQTANNDTTAYVPTLFNALDHVLQAPQVAKHYEDKKAGDHFFLEVGAGLNNLFLRSSKTYVDWEHIGYGANISVGDWITPEHGVKVSLGGQLFRRKGYSTHIKAYGISADYLMNITAVGSRNYSMSHRYELIGSAGLDLLQSRIKGHTRFVPGFHVGLRGQVNISNYTYIYIEPRISAYDEDLLQHNSRYGWRPAANLTAGVGYRLSPEYKATTADFTNTGQLLDNTFLSFSFGPGTILRSDHTKMRELVGLRASVSAGKWIDSNNGVRLSLSLMEYAYEGKRKGRVKGSSIGADYLLNLHNLFGGYNPNRHFHVSAVVGLNYNYVQTGAGKKWIPGAGAGLQANVRIGDFTSLFIEPRIDFYPKDFAAYAYTFNKADVVGSLLAGITLGQSAKMHNTQQRNQTFLQAAWYDHTFVEAAAGVSILLRGYSLHHVKSTLSPDVHIGLGKWFTPLSGVRLRSEASHAEWKGGAASFLVMGADYLWNLTNATTGYIPDRRFELIAIGGLSFVSHRKDGHIYLGGNLGVKGLWNVSPTLGLYLEPMLYAYDNAFLSGTTATSFKLDLLTRLHAGLQFNINVHDSKAIAAYGNDEPRIFYTASVGVTAMPIGARHLRNAGVLGRIGFGYWYSPLSAWRVSLGMEALRHEVGRLRHYSGRITVGADYLFDITAATLGPDDDRSVNVRAIGGINLGLRYEQQHSRFCPDLHLGMQFAWRIAQGWEVFAEPQLAYISYAKYHDKARHLLPNLQIGLNYRYLRSSRMAEDHIGRQFAEIAGSIGAWSGSVTNAHPFGRKIAWGMGASYGRFVGKHSAVRIGFNRTSIHKKKVHVKGSELNSFHLDYMQSLLPNESGKCHLRAAAGINVDAMQYSQYTRWGMGLNFGLQGTIEVSDRIEIFAEPTVTILSKSLSPRTKHPMEGEGKLFIGTRVLF